MIIIYKQTELDIYLNSKKFEYNINKDIDINLLRSEFNNSIGLLSKSHNSLVYWLMEISERNTLTSDLFLDICRVKLINDLISKDHEIKIHTNNLLVYRYFKKESNAVFIGRIFFILKNMLSFLRTYISLIGFIYKKLRDHLLFSRKAFKKDLSGYTIIQTWVNDGNFKSNSFIDNYFPGLTSSISAKKTITWPVFYNIKDKKKAINYLRSNSKKFVLSEDFLDINDYISNIKYFFVKKRLNLGDVIIANMDVSIIFSFYQKRELIGDGYLFYVFQKKLAQNLSKSITYIIPYENMIRDKALICGVNKYLSNSKIIGYFHTTKPQNLLCLDYANVEESMIAPTPDMLIFNSSSYREIYKNKYNSLKTENGLAYKQLYLRKEAKIAKNKDVLVIFSGMDSEIKLMLSLLNSTNSNNHYLFRMHPMNFFDISKHYLGNNFELVNHLTLDESLRKVSRVISTYSSVALESALKGFFVGLVYNKNRLLINPFDNSDVNNFQLISNEIEFKDYLESDLKIKPYCNFFNLDSRFNNKIDRLLHY